MELFRNSGTTVCIKMNRRSLVSLKIKNGLTDLNIYFFLLFALIQGWFKKEKKIGKFFFNVRNNPYEVFM
jgi:hypothetical protein